MVFAVALYRKRLICILVFRCTTDVVDGYISIVLCHVTFHSVRGVLHLHISIALLKCRRVEGDRLVCGWHVLYWTVAERLRRIDGGWGLMRRVQADESVLEMKFVCEKVRRQIIFGYLHAVVAAQLWFGVWLRERGLPAVRVRHFERIRQRVGGERVWDGDTSCLSQQSLGNRPRVWQRNQVVGRVGNLQAEVFVARRSHDGCVVFRRGWAEETRQWRVHNFGVLRASGESLQEGREGRPLLGCRVPALSHDSVDGRWTALRCV